MASWSLRKAGVSVSDIFKSKTDRIIDAVRTAYTDYYCYGCSRLITYVQYARYHGQCYHCHKLSGCLCRKRRNRKTF